MKNEVVLYLFVDGVSPWSLSFNFSGFTVPQTSTKELCITARSV